MPTETTPASGQESLRTGAVAVLLEGRGTLRVTGPDCADLLHGLVTNDVKALLPGSGCHAALLTPKGKMRAEMAVLRTEDGVLLDCEPVLAAPLAAILAGYVPFSRSALEDLSASSATAHVEGPSAAGLLGAAGLIEPDAAPFSHVSLDLDGEPVRVVRVSRAGEPGFDLRAESGLAGRLLGRLVSHGAAPADAETLEAGRIEAGLPRWGAELDETVLPNEAWLERTAISYAKGCYLGQETVARLRTYGHVNRHLVAILLPLACGAAPGQAVRAGGKTVGKVTSAVDSPRRGRRVALAYVTREHEAPGTPVSVDTPSGAADGFVAAVPLAR